MASLRAFSSPCSGLQQPTRHSSLPMMVNFRILPMMSGARFSELSQFMDSSCLMLVWCRDFG